KEDMMNKWVKEAEDLIDGTSALQKKLYDKTKAYNHDRYYDEKDTLEKHIQHWKTKRHYFVERLGSVHERMKRIGADGVNPAAAYVLIGIGSSVAAAAGYFFSVFTSAASFGNQDAFYFLLN